MESLKTTYALTSSDYCPSPKEYELKNDAQFSRLLVRVLAFCLKHDEFELGIQMFLQAGCGRFDAHSAIISHAISPKVHEVIEVVSQISGYYPGQHLSIGEVQCSQSDDDDEPQWFVSETKSSLAGYELKNSVQNLQVSGCLGTVVTLHDGDALLSFLSSSPTETINLQDRQMLELLSEGISAMLEHQRRQKHHRLASRALMSSGSIKSLEDYKAQAQLPDIQGIAGKVIEVLSARIGIGSLGIASVADELMLSKRTLQRRLQQNELSFADLRDQVRFSYSIDFLTRKRESIDTISAALDFSDRTSFTNAFKRWTGLSPSTFRKLFRDYT